MERPAEPSEPRTRVNRRRLLAMAGALGAGLVARDLFSESTPSASEPRPAKAPPPQTVTTTPSTVPGTRRWSDPATWGGTVPGPLDVAVVDGPVQLDVDADVAGVRIEPDGSLSFDPTTSRTLDSSGNVEVLGRLELRPAAAAVVHRLVFTGIDEGRFRGGGDQVLAPDVGLWVMGRGVLDAAGSPRQAWTRATGTVPQGATTVTLEAAPAGWQVGDEIVLTPTEAPGTRVESWASYDLATVAAVAGQQITLGAPTAFAHPEVALAGGQVQRCEVLNLTRNVLIEGTPTGRSHVFVGSDVPQSLRHAGLRHLGPRQEKEGKDSFVPGRYALHIHHAEEGSRGSLMEGLVGRDIGSHTFVTHLSHGVTWRDCISHDTLEEAYWWDPRVAGSGVEDPTNDVLYERCVASRVASGSSIDFRLAGFFLGAGAGSVARECVAVGVDGRSDASGFIWPETSEGQWVFEDCIAHNNKVNGIFVWQNSDLLHVITRFTGYHNGSFGVSHGAYKNAYVYEDCVLHANSAGAVLLKAVSKTDTGALRFAGLRCDATGLSDYDIVVDGHIQPPDIPTEFVDCTFRGARVAAFGVVGRGSIAHLLDIVDNSFEGNEFWLDPKIPADSLIRVQDGVRGTVSLARADRPGTLNQAWNASVNTIAPFAV